MSVEVAGDCVVDSASCVVELLGETGDSESGSVTD